MDEKKIVVFAPHPDDETMGCGGVVAKKLSEGYEVSIFVLTDGRYAFLELLGIDSDPTPNELKDIRRGEAKRAAKILGVQEENLIFLDFEDGTLGRNRAQVKERIIELLRKNIPSEVYFTYEGDVNPDHQAASGIIKDCIKELGLNTKQYRYSIAPKYSRIGPLIDTMANVFKQNLVRVDVSKFRSQKMAALEEFQSEIAIISSKQKRPVMEKVERFLKNKETFYVEK